MTKMKTIVPAFLASAMFLSSGAALADHNSPSGEGTANMPNDIHNTRIDTMDDDNDTFLAFVQGGGGADSTNRFLDDDSTVSAGGGGMGSGAGGMGGGYAGGR